MTKNFQTKNAFRDAVLKFGAPLFYDGLAVLLNTDGASTDLTVKGRAWHNGYSWCYYFREKYLFVKHGLSQDQLRPVPVPLYDPMFEHYTMVIAAIKHQTEILEILLHQSVVAFNYKPALLGLFDHIDCARRELETFNSLIKS